MKESQSQNELYRSRSIQNLEKSAHNFKKSTSMHARQEPGKGNDPLRPTTRPSYSSRVSPATRQPAAKRQSSLPRASTIRRSTLSRPSTSSGRPSSIRRLSRPSTRTRSSTRSSTRFDEDDFDDMSSKCKCAQCRIRHPPPWLVEERDRIILNVDEVQNVIDDRVPKMLYDLQVLVAFKSISVQPEMLTESMKALDWVMERLGNLKFETHQHPIPDDPHNCFEDSHQKVVFARYFSSPTKNTLLIYSHLDVVPAERDCWHRDPFELQMEDGLLYGRGVTRGKGMLVGWLQAFECWLKVHGDLPINVKIIVDMLHEVGSSGLQDYVKFRSGFFNDVDYMLFDTNSWLNDEQPVVACSLTGWAHFGIEVNGGNKSLEGGLAGGLVFEPMVDLCHLMNRLVDDDHEILIPHIDQNVKRLSTEEWMLLEKADFLSYAYREDLYVRRLRNEEDKVELLLSRWCKPALTMHGVQGAASRPGSSQVLPMHVVGKFSIRLVPEQDVTQIQYNVKEYIKRTGRELNIGTRLTVQMHDSCEPSSWSPETKMTRALMRAVSDIYGVEPIVTRGIPVCLPIASVLKQIIDKPVMLLPFYRRQDHHHQENEHIEELCIVQHAKVCASLLFELAQIRSKCKCDVITDYCNKRGVTEQLHDMYGDDEDEQPKRKRRALLSFFSHHENVRKPAVKKHTLRERIENFFRAPCDWQTSKSKKRRSSMRSSLAPKKRKIHERIQKILRSPCPWKKPKIKERIKNTSEGRKKEIKPKSDGHFPWGEVEKKKGIKNLSELRFPWGKANEKKGRQNINVTDT